MEKRKKTLGHSNIEVSAMGIGCWAIGGDSYGHVDDTESIRAIHCALDLGINLLDTANRYGHGHSEKVIGKALQGRRDKAVIATKFGYSYIQEDGTESGECTRKEDIARECEASLKRLNTDYIDLYQLHLGALSGAAGDDVIEGLEVLVTKGKIRAYGWSTDTPENARRFAALPHCAAIQYQLNLFYDNAQITRICEENGVSGLIRGPLAMGALTGKYNTGARVEQNDVRGGDVVWVPYFKDGKMVPDYVRRVEMAREILTRGGRSLTQGALAWLYAKSPNVLPIPGFKTAAQVMENTGALRFGPLTSDQMAELQRLLPPMAWSQM